MKNMLDRKITVRSLLTVLLIAALAVAAIGAANLTIQAALAPDVTIRYEGEVQTFLDSNGETVYPIMYKGTTYLPLRALSNMLGVPITWEGSTRTVSLGASTATARSLFNASTRHRDSHPYWSAIQGAENLPQKVDDFGVAMPEYTYGYRQTHVNSATTEMVLTLDRGYTEMSFTWVVTEGLPSTYRLEVFNADNKVVLSSVTIEHGAYTDVTVNVTGVARLGFRTVRTTVSGGNSEAWVLNPVIK